jgi:hypothetical protein
MKRTWVVYVQQGVGHEYHDTISNAEFYGPFTKERAEWLEAELNRLFTEQEPENDERLLATATPLAHMPYWMVVAQYQNAPKQET